MDVTRGLMRGGAVDDEVAVVVSVFSSVETRTGRFLDRKGAGLGTKRKALVLLNSKAGTHDAVKRICKGLMATLLFNKE